MPRALKLKLSKVQPSDAEVLRFVAKHEPLQSTLEAFPGLEREHLQRLLERAASSLDISASKTLGSLPRLSTPAPERVRVYSDGAARGNPGLSGAGAVLIAPSGQVVDRLGKFLGTQTNNFAEYMGLLLGLRRARALGVREVEVYADSELMIRQLGGRYQVKSPSLKPLYDEAVRLLNDFSRVKLVHVPREMNQLADEMSNRAIDERL
jgi:ribonuclease HI